jgi:hypothetical protein
LGGDVLWQYISKILKHQNGHLVCGKWAKKKQPPMEMSILKNVFITNLITDLDFPKKRMRRNCSSFFKIPTGSGSKMQKSMKIEGKLTYPQKKGNFAFLTDLKSEFKKKKSSFFTHFFERNPNLLSDL